MSIFYGREFDMLKHFISLLTVLFILSSITPLVYCIESTRAGSYLHYGVGAKGLGLAGAFRAIADDGTACYWNPAGSAFLEKIDVYISYSSLSLERGINFFSYSHPLPFGTLVFGLINSGVYNIKNYTTETQQGSDFAVTNNAFLFSYAKQISDTIGVGGNCKLLTSQIQNNSGFGIGFDIGVRATPLTNLSFGLVLQDLFSNITWNTESKANDIISMNISLGTTYRLLESISISAGVNKLVENTDIGYSIGVEYDIKLFAFRLGLNNTGPTAGFSLKLLNLISFGYAYVVDSLKSGDSHILSVNCQF